MALGLLPNLRLGDYPLLAVLTCFFNVNIFRATALI
jgi:hypothetical protein